MYSTPLSTQNRKDSYSFLILNIESEEHSEMDGIEKDNENHAHFI